MYRKLRGAYENTLSLNFSANFKLPPNFLLIYESMVCGSAVTQCLGPLGSIPGSGNWGWGMDRAPQSWFLWGSQRCSGASCSKTELLFPLKPSLIGTPQPYLPWHCPQVPDETPGKYDLHRCSWFLFPGTGPQGGLPQTSCPSGHHEWSGGYCWVMRMGWGVEARLILTGLEVLETWGQKVSEEAKWAKCGPL